jgi:hypothetical protein
MKRAGLVLAVMAMATFGLATPVLAAAPGNDLYAGRTVIPATPFTDVVDTSEATTDSDDAEAGNQCGGPPTDASVWYEHTVLADGGLIVETYESDYSVGIIVATGSPGSLSLITCGGGAVVFSTAAGETYSILVFDYQGDGGGNGGSLVLSVRDAPPPPELEFSVAKVGRFNPATGSATILGTVTCTGGDEFSKTFIDLQVSQSVGRFRINGVGFATFTCDGSTQAWFSDVFSDDGKFGGGKASVRAFGFVCTESGCDEMELTAAVTLKK